MLGVGIDAETKADVDDGAFDFSLRESVLGADQLDPGQAVEGVRIRVQVRTLVWLWKGCGFGFRFERAD